MPNFRIPAIDLKRRRLAAALGATALLSACGFQLRGTAMLPFKTLYVDVPQANETGALLKRNLRAVTNVTLVDRKEDADAILTQFAESRAKLILSINVDGRVREFRLRYAVVYVLLNRAGDDIAPPASISIDRDYSYSDDQMLSKEAEEVLLYRDMQADLVRQIIRRLAATHPS
jgi:LPS-assembly lipoprotein